jgi:ABC-2 type transport system permease protein
MMFKHIFAYRLKCLLRDRMLVFWTLLYPMVLATLFALAFSNMSNSEAFANIRIAIVDNAEYQQNTVFQIALNSVSDANPAAGQKLFHVSVEPLAKAEEDLKNNAIKGYVLFDSSVKVVVKESGIDQSILKEFVDGTLQARSAYGTILTLNPAAAKGFQPPDTAGYIQQTAPGKAKPNGVLTYFYALIAMAALMGGFWGNKEITGIQADFSPQAARLNMAPVHKLKALVSSFCAAILVQFISMVLLVAYMGLALRVNFGGQLPFVLIACLAGSFAGVMLGALISALFGKNESVKIGVLISLSMVLSFLAGLMVGGVKFAVTHAVPAMAWANPANLIADAFYSLYYYNGYGRFFANIGALMGMSAVFCLIVYFVTRRQRYASL